MGFLKRIFGFGSPDEAAVASTPSPDAPAGDDIPPERLGLNGEYDQSGLAKRVVWAFDQDNDLDDEERLWVAQTGGKVVLKGEVASQEVLDKMVDVASGVDGCTEVDTDQVSVG
ncbi:MULTISPECIES: BON domain-containing protein [unclassified Moorena]|uniref:BON domain-containing protein n=1 Tax=unclassified Moorena TaxID=2683338 RepID=UPI0013FE5D7B|nr:MULTISPECIES: BON domain-containing protein [unclassified Moorena]NEO13936.1 BON domain-containing protein [Moorena sp. SIO3E8]NEP99997.1 BON domain-containing protein [Moorena sp. SIO3F7]